jgi:pimeloyl-ACP methyl ester carboxylesterase
MQRGSLIHIRGAHGSQGRTSWSGRPELDDYTSYAALFMHYLCYIQPSPTSEPIFTLEPSPISPAPSYHAATQTDTGPTVILGGYSYGSMILRHLPPVPTILQPFASPIVGSAADEILHRARKLAHQSNLEWHNLARAEARARRPSQAGHNSRPSMAMGGEETSPDKRRSSRDVRRSAEGGSRLEIRTRLRSLSHRRREDSILLTPPETKSAIMIVPDVRYLLISPLTAPISTLAAPALGHKFWSKPRSEGHNIIGKHPSLAVYGDQDIFTSAKKIREWSDQLKAEPGSCFNSVEVTGAGHFWSESDVEAKLRTALRDWEPSIR